MLQKAYVEKVFIFVLCCRCNFWLYIFRSSCM